MNSDEIWLLQLWSGAIGSFVGAVIGGLVALIVVSLANRHQKRLSEAAMDLQKRLAREALAEQREQSRIALEEQRESLQTQLRENRAEASKTREIAALADLIPSLGSLTLTAMDMHDPSKLAPLVGQLQAASARWWMEIDKGPIRFELFRFTMLLHDLAERTVIEQSPAERSEWLGKLARAAGVFRDGIINWPKASSDERLQIVATIAACREELNDEDMFEGT